jgi:ribosome-associated translation inhibitor RaiA
VDGALDRIERQLVRQKERVRSRKGRPSAAEATAEFLEEHGPERRAQAEE